jgi:hypothetical protein
MRIGGTHGLQQELAERIQALKPVVMPLPLLKEARP